MCAVVEEVALLNMPISLLYDCVDRSWSRSGNRRGTSSLSSRPSTARRLRWELPSPDFTAAPSGLTWSCAATNPSSGAPRLIVPLLLRLSSPHFVSASCAGSLEGEVRQLDATLASLRQQLSEARGSLSHLEESRFALEKDIGCKTHSLFIERDKCMTHRKRYPTVSALSGYWGRHVRLHVWDSIWFGYKVCCVLRIRQDRKKTYEDFLTVHKHIQ